MLTDARQEDLTQPADFDLCIIGSGPAGMSLALQFDNSNIRVCLLEAGDLARNDESQALYRDHRNTGLHYHHGFSRLRQFGGTSGHWEGYCAPLDEEDFHQHEWIDESGWPISKKDIEPWYPAASEILELGTYDYDPAHWTDEAGSHFPYSFSQNTVIPKLWQFSPPVRFGEKYQDQIRRSENIHTFYHASLTRLILSETLNHIQEIEIRTPEGKNIPVKATYYILCCGAFENARMLLLNDTQIKSGIGNQNGLVGKFFMEHPHIYGAASIFLNGKDARNQFLHKALVRNTPVAAFMQIHPKIRKQKQLNNLVFRLERQFEPDAFDRTIIDHSRRMDGKEVDERLSQIIIMSEQIPSSSNGLTLNNETDVLGLRKFDFHLEISEQDYDSIARSLRYFARMIGESGMGRVKLDQSSFEDGFTQNTDWGSHHLGMTRMGASEREGVVDRDCRVFGIDNLYVGGSSVFPTGGCANPTFTIVALSLRLAQHLRTQLAHNSRKQ